VSDSKDELLLYVFEPCIVIYLCYKYQKMHKFYINILI